MVQIFAEQDRVAQHPVSLEDALTKRQSEVAVEDVENSTRLDDEIDALTVSWLAGGLIAQVVVLVLQHGKWAEHGDSEGPPLRAPHWAEKRCQVEVICKGVGLVIKGGARGAAIEFLQRHDVWLLIGKYAADAIQVVPFVDTDPRMDVVRDASEPYRDPIRGFRGALRHHRPVPNRGLEAGAESVRTAPTVRRTTRVSLSKSRRSIVSTGS